MNSVAEIQQTITIKGRPYALTILDGGPHYSHTHVYRLQSPDGNVYDVARGFDGLVECDCTSYEFRHRGLSAEPCKHGAALIDAGYFDRPTVEYPEPRQDEDEDDAAYARGGWPSTGDDDEPEENDRRWWSGQNDGGYSDDGSNPWEPCYWSVPALSWHRQLIEEGSVAP